jgi:RNA polymerase sigma-70 factor (ECF subfamily)
MEELSNEDIAEITGLRPGTIRVRLHRARLFVRKELARQQDQRSPRRGRKGIAESQVHPGKRNCKEMFAELSDYLDEQLDDSLCAEMEKHMEGCEPCKAFLENLEETIRTCRTAPNEPPDARVAANLRREVLSKYQELMTNIHRPDVTVTNPS